VGHQDIAGVPLAGKPVEVAPHAVHFAEQLLLGAASRPVEQDVFQEVGYAHVGHRLVAGSGLHQDQRGHQGARRLDHQRLHPVLEREGSASIQDLRPAQGPTLGKSLGRKNAGGCQQNDQSRQRRGEPRDQSRGGQSPSQAHSHRSNPACAPHHGRRTLYASNPKLNTPFFRDQIRDWQKMGARPSRRHAWPTGKDEDLTPYRIHEGVRAGGV
jgi:hypothetical protein